MEEEEEEEEGKTKAKEEAKPKRIRGDVAYNFEQNKERKRNDRSSRGMRVKARYRGEGNGRDGSPGDNGAQPAKAVGRYGWSDNRKISQWPIADASGTYLAT
uniref:Uncharacterized protein n=1 Tax=Vespula pensylvanica TaxID=30213 RepID=A0A834NC22_VESPE|nr:hypothetical protein H0235_015279 [Vespula pensylvanica]